MASAPLASFESGRVLREPLDVVFNLRLTPDVFDVRLTPLPEESGVRLAPRELAVSSQGEFSAATDEVFQVASPAVPDTGTGTGTVGP